ncbi:MAG: phage terminase large subunit [Ignavibacteria bacterium]|nr:phage terminase large subunit [Ignavibacteria bacterium]
MYNSPNKLACALFKEKWKEPPHIRLLDKLITLLCKRNFYRLIVNIPPRHGKSEFISKIFPLWYLASFEGENILLVTYQNKFAEMWGKKIRELAKTYGNSVLNCTLDSSERSSVSIRLLPTKSHLFCVGAGGSITGRGANLIILDDPIKNQKEATSLRQRDSLWDWFQSTLFTRLEPNGIIVIVMTRWHDDDLVGRILRCFSHIVLSKDNIALLEKKNEPSYWFLLRLPALATEEDLLGRQIGEPLWKERFDLRSLEERKQVLGHFWFSALYQQMPLASFGNIFRRETFRYFTKKGRYFEILIHSEKEMTRQAISFDECSIFATFDLAIKTTEQSDYTVGVVFGLSSKKDILILDVLRSKFDSADHLNLLLGVYSRWKPLVIGIESVQYQASLIQRARRLGLPIKELRADKDKISRSLPIATFFDAGKVYFDKDAVWLSELEKELLEFPNGKHDDQVDALAYIPQLIEPISLLKPYGTKPKRKENPTIPGLF